MKEQSTSRPRLVYSEHHNGESILLGTRSLDYRSSIHLFADSHLVRTELESKIEGSRCFDDRVHPTYLELNVALSTVTFFESVAAMHNREYGALKIIEHDNWHRMFSFSPLVRTRPRVPGKMGGRVRLQFRFMGERTQASSRWFDGYFPSRRLRKILLRCQRRFALGVCRQYL